MVVQCEKCQSRFNVDDAKIAATGTAVRCSKCKQVFKVFRKVEAAPAQKNVVAPAKAKNSFEFVHSDPVNEDAVNFDLMGNSVDVAAEPNETSEELFGDGGLPSLEDSLFDKPVAEEEPEEQEDAEAPPAPNLGGAAGVSIGKVALKQTQPGATSPVTNRLSRESAPAQPLWERLGGGVVAVLALGVIAVLFFGSLWLRGLDLTNPFELKLWFLEGRILSQGQWVILDQNLRHAETAAGYPLWVVEGVAYFKGQSVPESEIKATLFSTSSEAIATQAVPCCTKINWSDLRRLASVNELTQLLGTKQAPVPERRAVRWAFRIPFVGPFTNNQLPAGFSAEMGSR